MTILDGLTWLLGGGFGTVAYYLTSWLDRHTRYANLQSHIKRVLAYLIAGAVAALGGIGALLLRDWLGASPAPATAQAWVEAMYTVIALSIVAAQAVQAKDLQGRFSTNPSGDPTYHRIQLAKARSRAAGYPNAAADDDLERPSALIWLIVLLAGLLVLAACCRCAAAAEAAALGGWAAW